MLSVCDDVGKNFLKDVLKLKSFLSPISNITYITMHSHKQKLDKNGTSVLPCGFIFVAIIVNCIPVILFRYFLKEEKIKKLHMQEQKILLRTKKHSFKREGSCGVVGNMLDYNIIVSVFKLQLCYYINFCTNTLGKGMNHLIPSAMG